MKNEKTIETPSLQTDPTLRLDILALKLLDKVMTQHCNDPALVFVYARLKPGIEETLTEVLGPIKSRGRRASR